VLFNSYQFIFFFLPITFLIYFYLTHKNLIKESQFFLLLSSLFFYSWWNVIYLPIILFSMFFNYKLGIFLRVKNTIPSKQLLVFGILTNLSLLGYFKYRNFFVENINIVFNENIELINLALPLAISFFTFQQVAYLVDSYKGKIKENNFLNYAIFVTFFPQLIAGPIVHHKEMMHQFSDTKNQQINYENISKGLFIFSIGLFKKIAIADTFATWATAGFDVASTLNLLEAWATSLSYTFQLYFDFSGYTDMAIGLALLFNIKLPINFNSPYKARNIQEFWQRWHMTLSRFLKEYIYIPLGGNRAGVSTTYLNLMITFLLAGIWHGAGWTFVFWGFLHGIALVIHRVWKNFQFKLWFGVAWFFTFNFINLSWIFFRAKEWDDAIKVLSSMFKLDNIVLLPFLENKMTFLLNDSVTFGRMFESINGDRWTLIFLVFAFIIILYFKNSMEKLEQFSLNYKTLFFSLFLFLFSILSLNKVSEFLYFNF